MIRQLILMLSVGAPHNVRGQGDVRRVGTELNCVINAFPWAAVNQTKGREAKKKVSQSKNCMHSLLCYGGGELVSAARLGLHHCL